MGEAELKLSFYPVTVLTWSSTLYLPNPQKMLAPTPLQRCSHFGPPSSHKTYSVLFTFVPAWYIAWLATHGSCLTWKHYTVDNSTIFPFLVSTIFHQHWILFKRQCHEILASIPDAEVLLLKGYILFINSGHERSFPDYLWLNNGNYIYLMFFALLMF
jgi:hypothetical protein